MKKRTDIDVGLLRKLLTYDAATGHFYWSDAVSNLTGRRGNYKNAAGSLAGGPHKSGYWWVGIFGRKWMAHVLAWAYIHGGIPQSDIDHINRNKRDNRIANLRVVSRGQNMRNSCRNDKRGRSLGTTLTARGWVAQVSDNGKTINLGTFPSQDEAHNAHKQYVRAHKLEASSC